MPKRGVALRPTRLDRHSLLLVNRPLGPSNDEFAARGAERLLSTHPRRDVDGNQILSFKPYNYELEGSVSLRMIIGIRKSTWPRHLLRLHETVELVRRDEAEPQRFVLQRGAVGMRGLRDLGRVVV